VRKRPLWRYLVEGSAAREREDGTFEIAVRGYRMVLADSAHRDPRLHARLFESVQRSLRSIGVDEGLASSSASAAARTSRAP